MSWALKGLWGLAIFFLRMEIGQDCGWDHKAWSQGQEPEQVHKEVPDVTHKNWSCFCVFHYPNKGRLERHCSLNMPLNMKVQGKTNCPFPDCAPQLFQVNTTTANAQNWFLPTTSLLTKLLPKAHRVMQHCQGSHDSPGPASASTQTCHLEIQTMVYYLGGLNL